jgi:hypothetical protein
MKLRLIASSLLAIILSVASYADVLTLKEDHPETYTVVKGDTLWDISAHFLNSPWLWPRLWQANTQIENPHLIYPGDLLTLIWIDGEPRLTRKQLKKLSPTPRLTDKVEPVPTIPLTAISAFLSKDHVINSELLADAPRLLGDAAGTKRFFTGDVFYGQGQYDKQKLYGVYRLEDDYIDPDTEEFLGTELSFIGHAQVSNDPHAGSTAEATPFDFLSSSREARQGDLILPIPEYESLPAFFLPQPVAASVTGKIIATTNHVSVFGKYDTVVINKGRRENIQIGSMFAISQMGPNVLVDNESIIYREDGSRFEKTATPDLVLPAKRVGELMVFKVYEKVSIALVMRSSEIMGTDNTIQGIEF